MIKAKYLWGDKLTMQRKLLTLILISSISILSACGKDVPTTEVSSNNQKVVVELVKSQEAVKFTELSGSLKPSKETFASFEVAGKLVSLYKKEGESITSSDVLAVLDAEGYAVGVEQARANVMQAGAGLKQVEKGAREQELLQAKALVDKAQAGYKNALDNFNRVKVLYSEGAVSQSTYEATITGLTVAEKDVTLAKQSYSLAQEGATSETKEQVRAAYKLATSVKEQADLTLSKTKLKAPFDGTVVSKLASEGQLVSAGTPVYRIGNIDELKVMLPIPDYEINDWKLGDQVTLMLYEEKRAGKVSNIFPAVSQGTGTIGVEVTLPNPKHDWFVGQVVIAQRKHIAKSNLYIPVEAVISRGEEKPHVFKVVNNKAIKSLIELGELIDNKYEILSGLKEYDEVIIKGADRVYDGQSIATVRGN